MGTEVLRPQDCLTERTRVSPCRRRNYYYGNGNGNFANPSVYSSNNNRNNPRFNRKPTTVRSDRSDQRKKQSEPSVSKKSRSDDFVKICKNNSSNNKGMEKVTILRRGESLDSKIKSSETASAAVSSKKEQGNGGDLAVTSTDRLGPDPKVVSKQIRIVDLRPPVAGNCDIYAGSAFSVSPPPSSLPLPLFSKKHLSVDDSATRDLRRLLRLDI